MESQTIKQYNIPDRKDKHAVFDSNYLTDIPHYIQEWRVERIVLVISQALYNATDHVQKLEGKLGSSIVGRKIGVKPHSPYADVIEITRLLQDKQADCIISIGSGSYSDATKIASKLANTLPSGFAAQDVEALVDPAKGMGITKEAKVKVILIPTSLSAGEWNGTGSCTNKEGKKQHFGLALHKQGAADLILCDPELASTAPEDLWLQSGVRCIDHCIETICNRYCTQAAEHDALLGLRKMLTGLGEYKNDLVGRKQKSLHGISLAQQGSRQAIKALIVDGNSFGPSHAIGHQLGSVAGVAHGLTSCIMLAPVLRCTAARWDTDPAFERAREAQEKILKVFNDTLGWQEDQAADAVKRFVQDLGLPASLSELQVTDDAVLDRIAEKTLTDVWGGGPPQLTDVKEVMKILDDAR